MHIVGIWENSNEISTYVAPFAEACGCTLVSYSQLKLFPPAPLLVVSAEVSDWTGADKVRCKGVLLPGSSGASTRFLSAAYLVSYGASPRDTLTFSSLQNGEMLLSLQRELVTLNDEVVERQELVLPFSSLHTPLPFLAAVGTLLLMGLPPEELPDRIARSGK